MKGTKEIEEKNLEVKKINDFQKCNKSNFVKFLNGNVNDKNFKIQNSGITMIALIVIIVVLLILASISISVLRGNNGIISKSQSSKEQHEIASEKETLKLAVSEAYEESAKKSSKDKSVRIDKGILKNVLDDDYADKVENTEETDNGVKTTFTESGRKYIVDVDGNVTEDNGSGGSSSGNAGISADDFPASEYGAIIDNYTSDGSADASKNIGEVGWRVFYAGSDFTTDSSSRIYLIADDYINKSVCPNGKGGSTIYDNGNGYKLSMNNVYTDYAGASDIYKDDVRKQLNKQYFAVSGNSTSTNVNIRAVAYMLDTNIWNDKFKDNTYADYAIGGPSEEMLFASYNKKYSSNYKTQANNVGYEFTDKNGSTSSWMTYMSSESDYLRKDSSTYDPTYVINDTSKASGMWLASPSSSDSSHLAYVYFYGVVGYSWYGGNYYGFRPLVCLQSGVKLEKVSEEDGLSHYMLVKN